MLVRRVAALGDHALPTFAARPLPGLGIGKKLHTLQRRAQGQPIQRRAAFVERQRCQIPAIEPLEVEGEVVLRAATSRQLVKPRRAISADSGEGNRVFRSDADNLSGSAKPAVLC